MTARIAQPNEVVGFEINALDMEKAWRENGKGLARKKMPGAALIGFYSSESQRAAIGATRHWTHEKISETLDPMRLCPPCGSRSWRCNDARRFPCPCFLQTVAAPVAFTTTGKGTLDTTCFRLPPFTNAPSSTHMAAQPRFSPVPPITGTASAGNVDPTFRNVVAAGPIVDSFRTIDNVIFIVIGSDPELAF